MSAINRLPNITDHDVMLLRVFDAVVKAGSFTAAEVCLNKSKSAISVHISSLEARLGLTLCRRGRSGFALTPEGEKIYEICKDLFADLDRFRDRVSRVTSLVGGTLTVAIDDALLGHQSTIAAALANFKSGCPEVFLALYSTSPERVLQMLLDTSTDVGICAIPRDVPGTEIHPLYEEELALYCSKDHPLFTMEDRLITDEVLTNYESVDLGSYQESEMEDIMRASPATARSGQATARLILIMTGKLIGLLPEAFAEESVRQGLLRKICVDRVRVSQKWYALVRREVANSKVCNRMLLDLKRAFAAHSPIGTKKISAAA